MYKLSRMTISVLSYQTEISEKVNAMMEQFIPEGLELAIEVIKMRGQYRDRIRMHKITASKKKEVNALLSHFLQLMDEACIHEISSSLENYYNPESKTFYFRLDKFRAVDSEFVFAKGSDVIKIEVKFEIYKEMNIADIWMETLEKVRKEVA